jgi:eukaryotic-like serine/threonine-protein kinase
VVDRTVGNYVVEREIGRGGMGVVYLARHLSLGRRAAIKVLRPEAGGDPLQVQRFFNEARATSEIRHAHIVEVLDFGTLPDGGPSYLIMEWLEGRSLTEALRAAPRFALPRALRVASAIGRALGAAHARGIVHRDLKPDNVFLVERDGEPDFVKVLDFGIAKLLGERAASQLATRTGELVGTPSYMSPEQCRGLPVDPRTDVYALGVILYEMLTGRLPFQAAGLGDLLLAHMIDPPPPLDAGVPARVAQAVMRALEKDAARRFARMDELLRELGDGSAPATAAADGDGPALAGGDAPAPGSALAGGAAPAPGFTLADDTRGARSRGRAAWLVWLVLAVAALGAGAAAWVLHGRHGSAPVVAAPTLAAPGAATPTGVASAPATPTSVAPAPATPTGVAPAAATPTVADDRAAPRRRAAAAKTAPRAPAPSESTAKPDDKPLYKGTRARILTEFPE